MKWYSLILMGIFVVLGGLAAKPASAQELATLTVTVEDETGAVIVGAQVALINQATGARRTAQTNDRGLVVISAIPPGRYRLTVSAEGFAEQSLDVQLTVGQVASLSVTLTVTIEETIEVEAATAQSLDTAKAEVSQVIEERRITDLPIQGRQFIDFAKLTPSVTVGRSTSVGSQSPFSEPALKLSFGGVRETHSVFIALDGLDYTTSISGVQRASPSQDWVQEFRVVSNSYTADTGRHLGGIVNIVTKSGSNDVHGSIYYFFRNDALNTKNPLTSPGFETLRFNQFGFTASGPLVRNQTFLFGGYGGQRRAESPLYSDFILKNIDRINAVKQSLGLAAENLSILRINDYDQFIGKLTHHFSDATFLNARYLFTDQRNENVLGAPPKSPLFGLEPFEFGWGSVAFDYDNDSHLDVYWIGSIGRGGDGFMGSLLHNPGRLLKGDGRWGFIDVTVEAHALDISQVNYDRVDAGEPSAPEDRINLQMHEDGKGVATADFNNDGFPDLFLTNIGGFDSNLPDAVVIGPAPPPLSPLKAFTPGPAFLFINQGNGNHWLKVRLVGGMRRGDAPGSGKSNRNGIGAILIARFRLNGVPTARMREVTAGTGYQSMSSLIQHFGLGDATVVDELEIRWPSGVVQRLHNIPAEQTITVEEAQ